MGRKKIQISRITDERNRQVTFNKRKFGVMKKAYELSVLCDCEIALIIFSSSNKLYQYASTDMDKVLLKYTEYNEPHESLTNKNIIEVLSQKENKNGVMSPESPEQDNEYSLTPRTEAKYSKIDEDFQIIMQRNQQLASGQRVMANNNYTLPVSVPMTGGYGDGGMLQASPQMTHNISPRPSSSETDSVYPTGSILEMANGYPRSNSPLGESPSPGPSPNLGGHSSKAHNISLKQQSPGGQRNSNLRVVIPSSMTTNDDITYGEHRQQSALNTPVVALQTPNISGMSAYPSLNSFQAQDFSMSSTDVMSLPTSWTHQGLTNIPHASGLPHLTVPNNTPPPASSPLHIKVKSEPVSPPREHHQQQQQQQQHQQQQQQQSQHQQQQQQQQHHQQHSGGAMMAGHGLIGGLGGLSVTTMNNVASNLSGLHHQQQHMNMSSRPGSTGHLTPTPGSVTPTHVHSPGGDLSQHSRHNSVMPDYDHSPNPSSNKRPRISEGWAT